MAGMLTEPQVNPTPSSGPEQTPPAAANPGAGNPPRGSASGPGHQEGDFEGLRDKAVKAIYGDRFDKLVKMFQTNGPEKFARSMAIAINTGLTAIEEEGQPASPEMAAEVGMDIFQKLLEDMLTKPNEGMPAVVENVPPAQLNEVMPATLVMYADAHPDVSKEDIQGVMQEVQKGAQGQAGGDQMAANQAPPGPPPVPNSINPATDIKQPAQGGYA